MSTAEAHGLVEVKFSSEGASAVANIDFGSTLTEPSRCCAQQGDFSGSEQRGHHLRFLPLPDATDSNCTRLVADCIRLIVFGSIGTINLATEW